MRGGCCFSVTDPINEAVCFQGPVVGTWAVLWKRAGAQAVPGSCALWNLAAPVSLVPRGPHGSSLCSCGLWRQHSLEGAQGCWPFSSHTTRGSWDQEFAELLLTEPASAWTSGFSELLSEGACHPRLPPQVARSWSRLTDHWPWGNCFD